MVKITQLLCRAMITASISVMSILSVYCQTEVKFAMTLPHDCSNFFNGIATIKTLEDDYEYKIINRNGKEIGKAPGMLMYADDQNRIFEIDSKDERYILTDNNNKHLSKKYKKITHLCDGFFSAEKGSYPNKTYYILDRLGHELRKLNGTPYAHSYDNSPYLLISSHNNYMLYKDGQYITDFSAIQIETLSPDYPIIEGFIKEKGVSKRKVYIKTTGQIIYPESQVHTMAGIDFFMIGGEFDSRLYYDINGQPMNEQQLATSSKGIRINKIEYGKYNLVDRTGQPINYMTFEDVDPFYWQSDLLAVKKNGKWGYLNSNGSIRDSFIYDSAGPSILGISAVNYNDMTYVINFQTSQRYEVDKIAMAKPYDYLVEIIDGRKILRWRNKDSKYGFFNANINKSLYGCGEHPYFKNGIATTYYRDNDYQIFGVLLSIDSKVIARGKVPSAYFNYIGEGIYEITQKIDGDYVTYLYDKSGNEIYNSKSSKVQIQTNSKFHNGVIPVFIEGGINMPGDIFPHPYGYIYNIYTSSLENIIMNYGSMGQNNDVADGFIQERINYLDYYQILGNKALREERYKDAIEYFDKALLLNGICKEAMYGKAISLIHQQNYSDALQLLSIIEDFPGTNYAKAVCYYNLGSLGKARNYCTRVSNDDPCHNEAIQLRRVILQHQNAERNNKYNKTISILNMISGSLNLISQTMSNVIGGGYSYQPSTSFQGVNNRVQAMQSGKQKECPTCHGSGLSQSKERAAFYSYSEETHTGSRCEICGDRDSHWHKPCPSCNGKGYIISAF